MQGLPFLQGYRIAYMGEKNFEAEIVRSYGYALLVNPVPIATTSNQKSVAMLN